MKEWIYAYLVTPDHDIDQWLRANNVIITKTQEFADVVFFPGGSDVTPSLYGEKKLPVTRNDVERDLREVEAYHSIPSIVPKVGICRGSQFLNVMAGGKMYQDVNNHARGDHLASCKVTKQVVSVTSTHHQMMRPAPDGEVLMTASLSTRKVSEHGTIKYKTPPMDATSEAGIPCGRDVEVVWYPKERSLCYQPHPEYGNTDCEKHFWELYNTFIQPIVDKNTKELINYGETSFWQ